MIQVNSIRILKEAEEDLEQGRQFYAAKNKHVGLYFWDSLINDIELLSIYAGIHQKKFGYYRMLAKHFPYAIYYY